VKDELDRKKIVEITSLGGWSFRSELSKVWSLFGTPGTRTGGKNYSPERGEKRDNKLTGERRNQAAKKLENVTLGH